jgi:hypothetical protein
MAINRTGATQTSHSEQNLQNLSYDREFNVFVYEPVTYNPVSNSVERTAVVGQGNASLVLGYTDGNLTSISKTVDSVTYTKTLSYTDGNLTGVSSWTD